MEEDTVNQFIPDWKGILLSAYGGYGGGFDGCGCGGYGYGGGFALIVVLFILLIIVGAVTCF